MKYWIRPASLTTEGKQGELAKLFEKFVSILIAGTKIELVTGIFRPDTNY